MSEKSGIVRVIVNNELLSQPVLSIKVDEYNEIGLSSIILDPNFDSNGYNI